METPDNAAWCQANLARLASALSNYAKLNFQPCAVWNLLPNPQNVKFTLLLLDLISFFPFSLPSCCSLLPPLLFLSCPALKSVPFTARSAKRSSHVFYDSVFGDEVTNAIHNLPSASAAFKSLYLSFWIKITNSHESFSSTRRNIWNSPSTDLRNQPYRRTDGGRRSGKWKPGQQLHVSSDISLWKGGKREKQHYRCLILIVC